MFILSTLIVFVCIGTLGAREPDIDINRVRLVPRETSKRFNTLDTRGSIYQFSRNNDYDDHSSGLAWPISPLHIHDGTASSQKQKTPVSIHQPKEDPRLFYQSDIYLKEITGKSVNGEVSKIYPGNQVVRPGDRNTLPLRLIDRHNEIHEVSNICVRCPHDITLIAKSGVDRVILQNPRLLSCSGRKLRNVRFDHMYGPKIGSLIEKGSHMVVGRVMYKNKSLQLCKMQVHVVTQGCSTPKYLVQHCEDRTKSCNFSCRDPKLELHGVTSLLCGNDMKWKGNLPVCRARTWCEPPLPPTHGRLSCKGAPAGAGFVEGSKCRVQCEPGWRNSRRAISVCRRGAWTQALACQQRRIN